MFIVQSLARGKSRQDLEHLCQFYRTVIVPAMIANGGFREGKCTTDINDPLSLLIDEHWGSLPAFQWWQASESGQRIIQQTLTWLDGPPHTKIYHEVS